MEPLEIDEPAPAGRWPVERGLGALARVALAVLCAVVTVSVITRALWQNVVPDDVLLVSELMVAVILAPLALITARDEHISVSVFTRRAGAGARRLLAVLGHMAGICFFAVLAWAYFTMFSDSGRPANTTRASSGFRTGAPSCSPQWPCRWWWRARR
ncbi:MAG: TRAP transporter small permease [Gammaproteobacteria bacterium]|nr:TRAP transporter small permease [Gammaproteobacteria bacterium]